MLCSFCENFVYSSLCTTTVRSLFLFLRGSFFPFSFVQFFCISLGYELIYCDSSELFYFPNVSQSCGIWRRGWPDRSSRLGRSKEGSSKYIFIPRIVIRWLTISNLGNAHCERRKADCRAAQNTSRRMGENADLTPCWNYHHSWRWQRYKAVEITISFCFSPY